MPNAFIRKLVGYAPLSDDEVKLLTTASATARQ